MGTTLYQAPELLRGENYNHKVDIWATGVIGYMLLSGKNPFPTPNQTNEEMKQKILMHNPNYKYIKEIYDDDEAVDFI